MSPKDLLNIENRAERRWRKQLNRMDWNSKSDHAKLDKLSAKHKKATKAVQDANLSTSRWAILSPADQTIVYYAGPMGEIGNWTVVHAKARLFCTKSLAKMVAEELVTMCELVLDDDDVVDDMIEFVPNEASFCAREDTW